MAVQVCTLPPSIFTAYWFLFSFPSEMKGNGIDTITDPAISIVTANLQLVLLVEEWRTLCLRHVSMASRIARLMCVFLTGKIYCVLVTWITNSSRLSQQNNSSSISTKLGGGVAYWLGRGICNPEIPGSNPPACHKIDLCLVVPTSIPRSINSQLVSLQPAGIFNKFRFNLQLFVCLF